MKVFRLIAVLLTTMQQCEAQLENHKESYETTEEWHSQDAISTAISDSIRTIVASEGRKVDFIIYGETSWHIEDIAVKVIADMSKEMTMKIVRIRNIESWDHQLRQSAVILTKSRDNLKVLHERSSGLDKNNVKLPISTGKRPKFLVYVEELRNASEIHETQPVLTNTDMQFYEFVIINKGRTVDLVTKELYSEQRCGRFTVKLLNQYDKNSRKWSKVLENFEHYQSFHGCLLPFLATLSNFFYLEECKDAIIVKADFSECSAAIAGRDAKFHGLLSDVLKAVAKHANFTPHYSVKIVSLNLSDNVPLRGFRMSFDTGIYMIINKYSLLRDNPLFQYMAPYSTIDWYYLVTKGDFYSNYEKLTLPFDTATWVLLLITLAITFISVLTIPLGPDWLRLVVIGPGIRFPVYNVLSVFFGISQTRLPRATFARVLLMLFIWFCLIFRTCYQSKMFEFMTSDMRKPVPQTIEDLVRMNYTVLIEDVPGQEELKLNNELIGSRDSPPLTVMTPSQFHRLYSSALKEEVSRLAFFVNNFRHMQLNATFEDSLPIMKREGISKMMVIATVRNSILLSRLAHVVDRLIPSGILQWLVDYNIWYIARSFDEELLDSRRVLTLQMLEFGFVLWLAACFLSFLGFLCEHLWMKLRRQLRILIGLIDFLRVLNARLSDYHDRF